MARLSLLGAVCACLFALIATSIHAAILPLESRLGGLAYYDPNLDITWLADANVNGLMDWNTSMTWAENLLISGVAGWRLASMDNNGDGTVVACDGTNEFACHDNEYGYMYFENGVTSGSPGVFNNVQSLYYHSNTLFKAIIRGASTSTQGTMLTWDWIPLLTHGQFTAVMSAQSPAPQPPALWLFGSGLLGLIGVARNKQS